MAAKRVLFAPLLVLAAAACLAPAAAGAIDFSAGAPDFAERGGRSAVLPPLDPHTPYPEPSQEGEAVTRLVRNAFSFLGILVVLYTLVAVPTGIVLIANGRAEKKKSALSPVLGAPVLAVPLQGATAASDEFRGASHWFGLSGRVGRLWYVGVTLGSAAVTAFLLLLFMASVPLLELADAAWLPFVFLLWSVFCLIAVVLLWWCRVSACVRRLHDLGTSGAWYFVTFVPILGGLLSLMMFLVLAIAEGSRETNAYGPSRNAAR